MSSRARRFPPNETEFDSSNAQVPGSSLRAPTVALHEGLQMAKQTKNAPGRITGSVSIGARKRVQQNFSNCQRFGLLQLENHQPDIFGGDLRQPDRAASRLARYLRRAGIASPQKGRSPGLRPAWQRPKGIGEKVRAVAHQEQAPVCTDLQTVLALADRRRGGSASTSGCKGRQHDPGLPLKVSSIRLCLRWPRLKG